MIVEVCCSTVEEARLAARCGADRIELVSALEIGGLTPSLGELRLALGSAKQAGVGSAVMLRPRGGDFCYGGDDLETMALDGRILRDEGADCIVFGILKPDGVVDAERCKALMKECGDGAGFVFHMAFDKTPDWRNALDTLIELGFRRVLSKGQAASAEAGAGTLRDMITYAGSRIEILPGGGIRAGNVQTIIKQTGCGQIHFSLKKGGQEILGERELKDFINLCRRVE
ncbi:MAG: copper homeostasis protein CutC [Spirochaetaceae bacterium]|jgi:copper homeostasis protein|nr:copper homeostasis protein CutC [Spirochaetaceae bacterium]